jgi:hypothetical protein
MDVLEIGVRFKTTKTSIQVEKEAQYYEKAYQIYRKTLVQLLITLHKVVVATLLSLRLRYNLSLVQITLRHHMVERF